MPTSFSGSPREARALDAYVKLMRASETVTARLGRALQGSGVTPGQLGVLEALLHLGPMHACELGEKLLRSNANMTTVLDNLEKAGHVTRERSREDRRFVRVSLTPEGRRRIETVFPAHAAEITEALAGLTDAEQEELARLCKKLGRAAGEASGTKPGAHA